MNDSTGPSQKLTHPEHEPQSDVTRTPLLRFLLKLPLKKLTIWAGLLGLLVLLSDFFPLILMTFILSYIAATVVATIEHRFSARWIPVVGFFALVVAGLIGFVWITVRPIKTQVDSVQREIREVKGTNKWLDEKLREMLGPVKYESYAEDWGDYPPTHDGLPHDPSIAPAVSKSLSVGLLGHISKDQKEQAVARVQQLGASVWKGVVYVFLTVIFSLMLVWGLPGFREGLKRLESSRLAEVYIEVAPSIAAFGRLLGRAFEAQTIIAACNTAITLVGMYLLGIPNELLLAVVVFLCSFIPVAGVFISTTPIALVGLLMQGGGPGKLLGVVVMVCVAHVIEAYILNPRIYGHHMKMNPLAVLVILIIAEHTVGVWGLVVAIPLATYVWRYVILGESEEALELPTPPPPPPHPAHAPAPPLEAPSARS